MARRDDGDHWFDDAETRRRRRRARHDKQNRTLYILLAAGAVSLMFCGGVAVFVASAVKQVARAARNIAPPDRPFEAGEPDLTVSAGDLYKAYDRNEQRADDKYLGETVQVDGVVAAVDPLPGGGWRVTLSTGPTHARVHAEFDPNKGPQVKQLAPGQRCSIVGFCDGKVPDIDPVGGQPGFGWVVVLSACRVAG
jgi:hypothetical protein